MILKNLSSYDFERLVRDLLQCEYKVTLESFKSGRDSGIDLRYCSGGDILIVQCKHYAGSSLSSLIRDLENEKPKVIKLNPTRYVIATSLGLTPQNKTTIKTIFEPYCLSTADVLGCDDLNGLLAKFPEIEKRQFKLWLTSQAVLERVLHSELYNRSQIEMKSIVDKLKFYVQNDSYFGARQILDEHHCCIISGIPGIGKTTLAEILLTDYIAHGYEAFVLTNSVREAYDVYKPGKKQLFYYDDFLGQTSLAEKLGKNEDQDLLRMFESIGKPDSDTRFVLTTREYILKQAKLTYERLESSHFEVTKCILDLSSYTKFDKAKILFNHLYFSKLPLAHREEILLDGTYKKIISHRNYSPRIIQHMTQGTKYEDPKAFVQEFLENLDSPMRIWKHPFENQITTTSKALLTVLMSFPNKAEVDNVEKALMSYYRLSSLGEHSSEKLTKALRELEGSFINIEKWDQTLVIEFCNPSVRDFCENYFLTYSDVLLDLAKSSLFFEQCIQISNIINKSDAPIIETLHDELLLAMQRTYQSTSVSIAKNLFGKLNRNYPTPESRFRSVLKQATRVTETAENVVKQLYEGLVQRWRTKKVDKGLIWYLMTSLYDSSYKTIVNSPEHYQIVLESLLVGLDDIDDFEELMRFTESFPVELTEQEWGIVHSDFLSFVRDLDVSSDSHDEAQEYIDNVENVANSLGLFIDSEIEILRGRVKPPQDKYPYTNEGIIKDDRLSDYTDIDDEIESIFSLLIHSNP
ncbi:MAG: restriction endonuclease [Solirubrobacterales bacterium]